MKLPRLILTGLAAWPALGSAQTATWRGSQTHVRENVQITQTYEFTTDCDYREFRGNWEATVVVPDGPTIRRAGPASFTMPPGARRTTLFLGSRDRWTAELVGDSLILSNTSRDGLRWRIAGLIERPLPPGEPPRALDLTVRPDWQLETLDERVHEILTTRLLDPGRPCLTTTEAIERTAEHAAEVLGLLRWPSYLREPLRYLLRSGAVQLVDRAVDAMCDQFGLTPTERDAVTHLARAVRETRWICP